MQEADVLIVGGGASGLTASLLLSSYGVGTLLVSKYAETSTLPKAHLLSCKTMEMYRELGIEAAIREKSTPPENMRYAGWFAGLAGPTPDHGRQIARLAAWGRGHQDADWRRASATPYANLMQSRLEPLLKRHAEARAPDTIRFNHQFLSLEQDADGVTAAIEDRSTGETYQVRARYLLACDGGRVVGPLLGVDMEGHLAVATSVSVHFSADLSRWARDPEVLIRTTLNPDTGVPFVMVAVGPDDWGTASREWVLHFISLPGDHKTYDEAETLAAMRAGLGLPDFDPTIHVINRWPLDAVVASRFRVGRSFILGDAAHRMPPSGGHGLNSAVQDAYNLCWKLAAVLQGRAGDALLDSYEAERRPVARRTVASAFHNWQNTRGFAGAIGYAPTRTAEERWASLRTIWDDASAAGDEARRRVSLALTANLSTYNHLNINFGYEYPDGATIGDGSLPPPSPEAVQIYQPSTRPGCSVPNVIVEDLRGGTALGDRLGQGRFVLIAGEDGEAWCEAARGVAAERGIALEAATFGATGGDWLDMRREWLRLREFGSEGAILVRPDRFIAWRAMGAHADPASVLRQVFDTLLAPARQHRAIPVFGACPVVNMIDDRLAAKADTAQLKARELAYVRIQVPDLDQAERFFNAFGLRTRARTEDRLYLRSTGPEHHVLVAHVGEQKLLATAYELAGADELERAARLQGASPIEAIGGPGGGRRVMLRDLDGNGVELVYGIETTAPIEVPKQVFNSASERDRRRNEVVRPHRGPSSVLRIGHVVIRSPQVHALRDWYTAMLGLLESDDVPAPDGDGLLMSFVRLDQGDTPVDHHVMQILKGGRNQIHHISFEVQDIDDLYVGHDAMAEAGYRHMWGIGRHVQGSQIFDYWIDPFGVMYEHWTDTDMLDASVKKGITDLADMHAPWGPQMPDDFIAHGSH